MSTNPGPRLPVQNGVILPKTSNVARSNSLRSTSPPRIRRELRNQANVPPVVPEESPPVPPAPQQYPSMQREPSTYTINKPILESPVDWNQHGHEPSIRSVPEINDNHRIAMTYQNIQNANVPYQHNHPPQTMVHGMHQGLNGNNMNMGK
jgi:p21-activated kinase 5